MIKLRDYQQQAISKLQDFIRDGNKRPILTLPTGSGKGRIIAAIAASSLAKNRTVLITAHRTEILEQLITNLNDLNVDFSNLHLETVQTLQRSPHKIPDHDLCIIDECHIGNFRTFMQMDDPEFEKYYIGVTATPMAASRKNPLWKQFDGVVEIININKLIKMGFLSKPIYKIAEVDTSSLVTDWKGEFSNDSQNNLFNQTTLLHDIDDAFKMRDGKTIIFTSNVETTTTVAKLLDIPFVHSKMPKKERDAAIADFKSHPSGAIVNCGILTTGFDDPQIKTVIVYRATTSLALWLQMCGRGSRVIPNQKDTFTIIDLGGNVERLQYWHQEHDWTSIMMNQGRKIQEGVAPVKECPKCEYLNHASARVCQAWDCDYVFPQQEKPKEFAQSWKTVQYGDPLPENLRKKAWREMDVDELIARAKIGSKEKGKSWKLGWIINQIKSRGKENWKPMLIELAKKKGYKSTFVYLTIRKFEGQT